MLKEEVLPIQAAVRSFIDFRSWSAPHAATLSLKQALYNTGPCGGAIRVALNGEHASGNFRHFRNLLNRALFGKAFTRFGRQARVFAVQEGGGDKRLHYHALLECPRAELIANFPRIVEDCWRRTDWGYDEVDVSANATEGWVNYITKLRTKEDFASSIDWMNVAN